MGFNFNIGYNNTPQYAERDMSGNIFYTIRDFFSGSTSKGYASEENMLEEVLSNPAALKVITFLADTYSQVKFNDYTNNKDIKVDFLYEYKKQPNPYQSWIELNWDIAFWRALGNAYVYVQNDVWYCLNPVRIDLTKEQKEQFTTLAFSDSTKKQALKGKFKYKDENGKAQILELSNLHVLSDLSNSVSGNWIKGSSRLNALYTVLDNSRMSLKAKNRNLFYTTKFLVSGQHDPSNITSVGMGENEQKSIESKLKSSQEIHVSKNKTDVNQLVNNLASLKLDDSYVADLSIVGNMYGVSKDVLDIMAKGSTFENKEKSIGAFIDYTLMPKVQQHSDLIENILDIQEVRGSFKHLPFNAIFEAEKVLNRKTELESLKIAFDMGYNVEEQLKKIYDEY